MSSILLVIHGKAGETSYATHAAQRKFEVRRIHVVEDSAAVTSRVKRIAKANAKIAHFRGKTVTEAEEAASAWLREMTRILRQPERRSAALTKFVIYRASGEVSTVEVPFTLEAGDRVEVHAKFDKRASLCVTLSEVSS